MIKKCFRHYHGNIFFSQNYYEKWKLFKWSPFFLIIFKARIKKSFFTKNYGKKYVVMATMIKCASKVWKIKVYSTNIIFCKYWSNIYLFGPVNFLVFFKNYTKINSRIWFEPVNSNFHFEDWKRELIKNPLDNWSILGNILEFIFV
jgi:hypothetical protein